MNIIRLNQLPLLLFILQGFLVFFQEKQITGNVVNANITPILGVSVLMKGTNVGITIDFDVNYELRVPRSATSHRFSYVGYNKVEVTLLHQSAINVTMIEDAVMINKIIDVGFKGAEQSVNAVRRNVKSVTDVIIQEDIGDYSDENIEYVLQWVNGLEVEHYDSGKGGGDLVSV